jgi:hypothetical protein
VDNDTHVPKSHSQTAAAVLARAKSQSQHMLQNRAQHGFSGFDGKIYDRKTKRYIYPPVPAATSSSSSTCLPCNKDLQTHQRHIRQNQIAALPIRRL